MHNHRTIITWPETAAILLARFGALWLIVILSLLLPEDSRVFYALLGIAYTISIPYALWLRSKLDTMQFASFQFIADLLMITGLVFLTDGAQSKFTMLYPLVILCASIAGTPRQAIGLTVSAIVMFALMTGLQSNRIYPEYTHRTLPPDRGGDTMTLALQGLVFALFGGVGMYIAKRCDRNEASKQVMVNTTRTLLENIPASALLLSEKGEILSVNEQACFTLNTSSDELCGRSFAELRHDTATPLPESFGPTATLLRDKATPLPVSYRTRDFFLPESALFEFRDSTNEPVKVTLLLFNDISEELSVRRQLEKIERITNATRIAGEMAHEIQGPLASLSASVQLLKHYESKATAADWLPNSPRRKDRIELFEHIEDASARIDTSIKNFVDFAEFSPQDLLSIIKLDSNDEKQGYIGHLNTIGRDHKDGKNSHCG